jgi:hypothetical protein
VLYAFVIVRIDRRDLAEDFSYPAVFIPILSYGAAITLGFSLVIYVVIRAIGWVIGGFAS